jgi:hypothetical protein
MHGLIRLVDTAELLATELVSNAVRHTKGPAALRVRWSAGVLRIGAWDADPQPPEPPVPLEQVADVEEGRGLELVRACADLWVSTTAERWFWITFRAALTDGHGPARAVGRSRGQQDALA